MKIFFRYIFICGMLFFLVCGKRNSFAENILTKLETLSKEDQVKLENLFRILVVQYGFGYTLFGEKPITIQGVQSFPIWVEITAPNPNIVILREGFEVWNRCQHLFSSKKFMLKIHQVELEGRLYDEFYIMNLSKIKAQFLQYPFIFPSLFSSQDVEQKVLSIFSSSSREIEKGILFGFGEHNARFFARKNASNSSFVHSLEFPQKSSSSCNFLHQKLQEEWKTLEDLYPRGPLTLIPLPGFMAHARFPETSKLYHHYHTTQKTLTALLQAPNFLELFLMAFTGKNE